jgi:hypothetical protein
MIGSLLLAAESELGWGWVGALEWVLVPVNRARSLPDGRADAPV